MHPRLHVQTLLTNQVVQGLRRGEDVAAFQINYSVKLVFALGREYYRGNKSIH